MMDLAGASTASPPCYRRRSRDDRHPGELPHPLPAWRRQGRASSTASSPWLEFAEKLRRHRQAYPPGERPGAPDPRRPGRDLPKFGTDLRLLQGVGELSEPSTSSRWAPPRHGLPAGAAMPTIMPASPRRLMPTASLPATSRRPPRWIWAEPRRYRLRPPAGDPRLFLSADAVLAPRLPLAGASVMREGDDRRAVAPQLPFMATPGPLLMESVLRTAATASTSMNV